MLVNFNTSHVTVYRIWMLIKMERNQNFNTSHVTVYLSVTDFGSTNSSVFQYISCYGLSFRKGNHLLQNCIFQYISCYGLSYTYFDLMSGLFAFQYISCYGLSKTFTEDFYTYLLFQYISCYGLSKIQNLVFQEKIHFNTSHVTVYLQYVIHAEEKHVNFNTSHVTVYHYTKDRTRDIIRFQYISCYGLSIS